MFAPGSKDAAIPYDIAKAISDTLQARYHYNSGSYTDVSIETYSNKFFGRIDWNINEKHKLQLRNNYVSAFGDYLENLIYTTVGIGILFQMPLLVMVLAKIGIITGTFLRKYRRHAIVIILIAAAIITPSTDPFSLTLVTIPLYLLFEASIILASKVEKDRKKADEKEWS